MGIRLTTSSQRKTINNFTRKFNKNGNSNHKPFKEDSCHFRTHNSGKYKKAMGDKESSNKSTVPENPTQPVGYAYPADYSKKITGTGTPNDPWVYTDEYGIMYSWDAEKQIWASKVREICVFRLIISQDDLETLIAQQQAAYNAQNTESNSESLKVDEERKEEKSNDKVRTCQQFRSHFLVHSNLNYKELDTDKEERKRKKREKKKQKEAEKRNTSVYVTGLPSDISDEDFYNYFVKCGVPKKDIETGKKNININNKQ